MIPVIKTVLMEFEKKKLLDSQEIVFLKRFDNNFFFHRTTQDDNEIVICLLNELCSRFGLGNFKLLDAILKRNKNEWNDLEIKVIKFDNEADEAAFILYFNDRVREYDSFQELEFTS
jgi:hypothetical protein